MIQQFRVAPLFFLAVLPTLAQTWVSDLVLIPFENDSAVGTTAYHLAKLDNFGRAVTAASNDTGGIIGVVQQGAGRTGRAGIAQVGVALCDFDGPTTSGDYVQASSSTAGLCHDAGREFPASGSIVGRAMSTNSGAGIFELFVFPGETQGATRNTTGASNTPPPVPQVVPLLASGSLAGSGPAGGPTNSVQYKSGSSSLGGVINSSPTKRFLTQSSGSAPAFGNIEANDLPVLSSANLSDSSALVRSDQVNLPGTTPSIGSIPEGSRLVSYGDSITAGKGASSLANEYVHLISGAKNWALTNHAVGGDGLFDQIKDTIWRSTTGPSSLSLLMIGANDNGYVYHQSAVWTPALQAAYLWLLTQQKSMGASLKKTGSWSADPILSTGIYTTEDKSSATGRTFGNVVYVVARSTPSNSPTFTITVDDAVYGPYKTPVPWTTLRGSNFAPYAVRIGNLADSYHTVTVTNRGSGELHVDFIADNKAQVSPTGPYLLASTVYKTTTGWEFSYKFLNDQIRTTATQLAADGLGIVLADVEGDCANPQMIDAVKPGGSNCSGYDGEHPNDAGHRIIANSFLRMIPSSGSSTFGKYPSSANFVSLSAATASLDTVSTNAIVSSGWLALKAGGPCYWLVSAPGHFASSQNGMCSIGTDTSGSLNRLNSPHSVRATNVVGGGYATRQIDGSGPIALDTNTAVWNLIGNATPVITVPAGEGIRFTILICQNATGGHHFTWPASVKNGMTVGTAPNECSVQEFVQTQLGKGDLVGVTPGSSFQQ